MVIAHHLVWTTYGTWLPNDPRGSWSQTVVSPQLAELGEIHFGRRKTQPSPSVVREFKQRAAPLLVHPMIRFDLRQIELVGAAFSEALRQFNYTCYACAIMPDHVHLLIRKHRDIAESMLEKLQTSTRTIIITTDGSIPADHPVWTAGGWKRFLGSPDAVRSVIRYIEANRGSRGRSCAPTIIGRFTNLRSTEKIEPTTASGYTTVINHPCGLAIVYRACPECSAHAAYTSVGPDLSPLSLRSAKLVPA